MHTHIYNIHTLSSVLHSITLFCKFTQLHEVGQRVFSIKLSFPFFPLLMLNLRFFYQNSSILQSFSSHQILITKKKKKVKKKSLSCIEINPNVKFGPQCLIPFLALNSQLLPGLSFDSPLFIFHTHFILFLQGFLFSRPSLLNTVF